MDKAQGVSGTNANIGRDGSYMAKLMSPDAIHQEVLNAKTQRRVGLLLAGAILLSWLVLHVWLVFHFQLSLATLPPALALVALQTWLYVGMFIIAHDCMHGSLVPFRPRANRLIGQVCLLLYAGFSFDKLNRAHHRHHQHAGTSADPDFHDAPPHHFWPWFFKFFFEYFTFHQIILIAAVSAADIILLGASPLNIVVFWAVPGLLSALQLFTFGTYLPHRPHEQPFHDRHNARTNSYPQWLSLLTCFHFGYHHEHHLFPSAPWWRLPAIRSRRLPGGS